MSIREAITQKKLILDGGMGTELYKRGIKGDTALASINAPQALEEIHRAYIQAGADIITANTFSAYGHKHGNAAELIAAAFDCAKKAREGESRDIYIAMDMGATGMVLEPYGDVSIEECREEYAVAAKTGAENGADLIIVETIMDINELTAAVDAAAETGLPIMATMSFTESGRTMYGASIEEMAEALNRPEVIAIGMNCGFGPKAYMPLIESLVKATNKPIILQPNAGLPSINSDGVPTYDLGSEDFATLMGVAAAKGVRVFGGCCGTTPAHISAMVAALR